MSLRMFDPQSNGVSLSSITLAFNDSKLWIFFGELLQKEKRSITTAIIDSDHFPSKRLCCKFRQYLLDILFHERFSIVDRNNYGKMSHDFTLVSSILSHRPGTWAITWVIKLIHFGHTIFSSPRTITFIILLETALTSMANQFMSPLDEIIDVRNNPGSTTVTVIGIFSRTRSIRKDVAKFRSAAFEALYPEA